MVRSRSVPSPSSRTTRTHTEGPSVMLGPSFPLEVIISTPGTGNRPLAAPNGGSESDCETLSWWPCCGPLRGSRSRPVIGSSQTSLQVRHRGGRGAIRLQPPSGPESTFRSGTVVVRVGGRSTPYCATHSPYSCVPPKNIFPAGKNCNNHEEPASLFHPF